MRQQGVGTTGSRFRQRKLNVKTSLSILRERDFATIDGNEDAERQDAALTSLPKVESGVDTKEEKEHHLQAAITASQAAVVGGKINQIYIPTPDAVLGKIDYATLYPSTFSQPATYIRFSSTVEDSIGCPYCMTQEDETVLKQINKKKSSSAQCSEDQFEVVMNFFEETSQARQPFAAIDNTPVLSYEEMESAFDDTIDEGSRTFAKEIYPHWSQLKSEKENGSLMPKLKTLKMETGQEIVDDDPYICFRRREVRQVRKTRGRDAQIIEKLKKLRKELEEGRQLLNWVKNREEGRKEDLKLSKQIFEQRAAIREMKRTLNISEGDEDLLITQRTPKRKPVEPLQPTSRQLPQPRLERAPSIPDMDMVYYKDKLTQREETVAGQIEKHFRKLDLWNTKFVDRTKDFLWGLFSPSRDGPSTSEYVGVQVEFDVTAQQEPTPPPSVDGDTMEEDADKEDQAQDGDITMQDDSAADTANDRETTPEDDTIIQLETPSDSSSSENQFMYRQRRGRGGLMLDRRMTRGRRKQMLDAKTRERWKYDRESGDEDDEDDPPIDLASVSSFRYRQHLRGWDAQFRSSHSRPSSTTERPAAGAAAATGESK